MTDKPEVFVVSINVPKPPSINVYMTGTGVMPVRFVQDTKVIRLTDHEASRAADKARIAELTEALVRCRHQASYTIGEAEALSNQLHKVREIASAALAQQGKEGGV